MTFKNKVVCEGINKARQYAACELAVVVQTWLVLPNNFGGKTYNRLFSPVQTFWLFLSQVLDERGSCRETLHKYLAWLALQTGRSASSSTAAYCKARRRLKLEDLQGVHTLLVTNTQRHVTIRNLWCGRHVKVVDGSSVSMPDTEANQECYPQPSGQKPGCGFPVMRIVAVFSLATGVLLDVAKAALSVHERTLFHRLWDGFSAGDVLLADKGLSSYADYYLLAQRGVDTVMPHHQSRKRGVKRLRTLGKNDALVQWDKTAVRPRWISPDQWMAIPQTLTLRQVTVEVDTPGFRSRTIRIVTTLLDPKIVTKKALADLYRRRWSVELYLRHIKTTMGFDVLTCKTPEMIHRELQMAILAYNLIRAIMLQATLTYAVANDRLSFKGTLVTIRQWTPRLAIAIHFDHTSQNPIERFVAYIASDLIPLRPDRVEPRARKRRPKNYGLLTAPRTQFIETPHRNKHTKAKS